VYFCFNFEYCSQNVLFIIVFLSSPTFSNSPFLLILLQVVHLKLEKNDFLVVFPCIFGSHGVELWE
jgi:hypothetical protein